MDELAKELVKRAGLTDDEAKQQLERPERPERIGLPKRWLPWFMTDLLSVAAIGRYRTILRSTSHRQ